jgi:hypothetical protein
MIDDFFKTGLTYDVQTRIRTLQFIALSQAFIASFVGFRAIDVFDANKCTNIKLNITHSVSNRKCSTSLCL